MSAPRVIAVMGLLSLGGCSPPSVGTAPAGPKTVGVVTAEAATMARATTQPGTLQPFEEAVLSARSAGYLRRIHVDRGDRVLRGALLAEIEIDELQHQAGQARAVAAQSRAEVDESRDQQRRATAEVEAAGARIRQEEAAAGHSATLVQLARSEQQRAESRIPRLRALIREAELSVIEAGEAAAQARAVVVRHEQQAAAAEAEVLSRQAAVDRAGAETRLAQSIYDRLKAIQDRDRGLIPAQDVDVARTRLETRRSDLSAATARLEGARQELGAARQQVEAARRGVAASDARVEACRSRKTAAEEEVRIAERDIATATQSVRVAEAGEKTARERVAAATADQASSQAVRAAAQTHIRVMASRSDASRSAQQAAERVARFTRILSPFDGLVTERYAHPGDLIQNAGASSTARGVVKVVRDDRLRLIFPIPEAEQPYVREGGKAQIAFGAAKESSLEAVVSRVSGALDPIARTMQAEVWLDNRERKLRPGSFARVTLTLETHANAVTVPTECVMGKDDHRFVYAVVGGKAKKTPVKVGFDDGKKLEILEGLAVGATVVVTGRETLVDGADVKTEPAPAPKSSK